MERFGETTRNPQFSVRHKRGTEDTLNPKKDVCEEIKTLEEVVISQSAGFNPQEVEGN